MLSLLAVMALILGGCGQPTREEVLERYEDGRKKVVAVYQGKGTNEKMIARHSYDESGVEYLVEDLIADTTFHYVDLHPDVLTADGLRSYVQGQWRMHLFEGLGNSLLAVTDIVHEYTFRGDTLHVNNYNLVAPITSKMYSQGDYGTITAHMRSFADSLQSLESKHHVRSRYDANQFLIRYEDSLVVRIFERIGTIESTNEIDGGLREGELYLRLYKRIDSPKIASLVKDQNHKIDSLKAVDVESFPLPGDVHIAPVNSMKWGRWSRVDVTKR